MRYIHQNPRKAGIIYTPEDYKWSSYFEYVNKPEIVDIDVVLGIFSDHREIAQKLFYEYSMEETADECLEYQEKVIVTDQEILQYLRKQGITSVSQLQQLSREQRNNELRSLKERNGVTIRQLARITGISKSVIDRI